MPLNYTAGTTSEELSTCAVKIWTCNAHARINPGEQELQDITNEIDYGKGGGTIDFEDFVKMMEDQKKPSEEEEIRTAFDVFDSDHKEFIESGDIRGALHRVNTIPPRELEEMLVDLDLVRDRKFTFEEFKKLVTTSDDKPKRSATLV
ncbi:predicted protein [Nematostella vectensis]|uniref:EF-hand domain-containing protein n=1 Tax=Nematostella vectensis TaxID=45351 RepID=A7RJ54_NEMVE|nr:predicted protein [Nematostella vectensis]|eukprot:XP_001640581.1 predicted protein [Nematostella vectensis]